MDSNKRSISLIGYRPSYNSHAKRDYSTNTSELKLHQTQLLMWKFELKIHTIGVVTVTPNMLNNSLIIHTAAS